MGWFRGTPIVGNTHIIRKKSKVSSPISSNSWSGLDSRFEWPIKMANWSDLHFGNHFRTLWRSWFISYTITYSIQVYMWNVLPTNPASCTLSLVFFSRCCCFHSIFNGRAKPAKATSLSWLGFKYGSPFPQNTWMLVEEILLIRWYVVNICEYPVIYRVSYMVVLPVSSINSITLPPMEVENGTLILGCKGYAFCKIKQIPISWKSFF